MHRWGMLAVGLCISGALFAALANRVAADPPQEVPVARETVELPYAVENTQLLIRELAVYEGPFWEDGSGEEVTDVAALVVENTGGTMICQGQLRLETEAGVLEFSVSWLPADSVALIPEKNRARAGSLRILSCSGWNTTIYPEMTGAVTAREQGMGELLFINHTTQTIAAVEAVYKSYDPDSGMYIGGNSGTVRLEQLKSGEERAVAPYQYAKGYSKIVCILLSG